MLVVAAVMDAVAATHEDYWFGRGEHVFAAYWTVAVGGALDAAVGVTYGDGHTYGACL